MGMFSKKSDEIIKEDYKGEVMMEISALDLIAFQENKFIPESEEEDFIFESDDDWDDEEEELNSVNETIADIVPGANVVKNVKSNLEDLQDLKNQWKKFSDSFTTHKWIYRLVKDDKQSNMLHKWYDILTGDVTYGQYKRAYTFFCSFFGIPNKGTIIEWLEFSKEKDGQEKCAIRYSKGLVKVNIPEGVYLIHTSPVLGLKQLEPSFRSKTKGKFMYPNNRVYFTIQKKINPFKYGVDKKTKQQTYTPTNYIDTAYIDPTYILFKDRSVYVETEKPIPVTNFIQKMASIFKRKGEQSNA